MPRTHHFYRITVTGRGHFPLDMLRHDQCFPLSATDSEQMYHTFHATRDQRTIELGCATKRLHPTTDARWESFGWTVDSVEAI